MRKLTLGALLAIGLVASSCATDVQTEDIATLEEQDLCRLSGGEYKTITNAETKKTEGFCYCGGKECGKGVNCTTDNNNNFVCGGVGYTFLTEGLCTMIGVEVCADRITADGEQIGYLTTCENNRWTDETVCPSNNSCQIYMFGGFAMSSKCGECHNGETKNGKICVYGKFVDAN